MNFENIILQYYITMISEILDLELFSPITRLIRDFINTQALKKMLSKEYKNKKEKRIPTK